MWLAAAALAKVLIAHKNCVVDGIELDQNDALAAKKAPTGVDIEYRNQN